MVERVVLDMGFTWHPTNANLEAGIDGTIEIRDPVTGEATSNIIQVQVKATTRNWVSEDSRQFTCRCEDRDIEYWMQANTPVVLVAVRPQGDEAYWANVKEVFDDPKQRRDGRIRFDKKSQRFDASAGSALIQLAVPRDQGPYIPAPPHGEILTSNLLEVRSFPPAVYVGSTDYRQPQEVFDWARERGIDLRSGWLLTEKSIRTVHDLREGPWVDLVDRGSVERFDVQEWADSDDPDRRREFVRLMTRVLLEDMRLLGLWRSSEENCFYFPARRDEGRNLQPRAYSYTSRRHKTSREVASIHYHPETNEITYCRHSALKCAFVRVQGQWCLALIPHYLYTTDGKALYRYGEDLLSGIKRLEWQDAVVGQVLMWKHKLTRVRRRGLFDRYDARKRLLSFGGLLKAKCDRGVDDEDWLRSDAASTDAGKDGDDDSPEWGLF